MHAIKESVKNGNWILIENVHLIEDWPVELIKLIYVLKYFNLLYINYLYFLKFYLNYLKGNKGFK